MEPKMLNVQKLKIATGLLIIILASVLNQLPLPTWLLWVWPPWLVLTVLFFAFIDPPKMGIASAFGCGLLLDILRQTPLGIHAFSLTVITFIILNIRLQLKHYPWWQQTLCIGGLVFLYQLISIWLLGRFVPLQNAVWFWAPALSSVLVWPLVAVFLSEVIAKLRLNKDPYCHDGFQ